MHTEFENLKGSHFRDLCVEGRIILKWILNKVVNGFIWLKIE
jgi:hypothetical protein